ncbi:MAG: hypothetical protein IT288_12345 [Bdellovibrionales bacterium]|nr:hypothetical protein [Bdellovibrionales bacterium]
MRFWDYFLVPNRSIGHRIVIPVNLFIALFLALVGYLQIENQEALLKRGNDEKVQALAMSLEASNALAVKHQDKTLLGHIGKQLLQSHVVDGLIVYDAADRVIVSVGDEAFQMAPAKVSRNFVDELGITFGRLEIYYNYHQAISQARQSVSIVALIVVGVQLLMSIFILLLVRRIVQPLNRMRHQLEKGTTVNEETSLTLKSSAEQLSSSSAGQASAVQESVSAMAEMKSMIGQTAGHVNECQRMSEGVKQRTQDGSRIMGDMATSMVSIESSNQQLENLVSIISEIRSKTKIINDIVFKTQLLSFNASIEAARAGQHGRGFAVVAEEVGNLAQMSGKASKEIESLLQNSQQKVQQMIADLQSRITDGKGVTKEAMDTFQEISEQIVIMSNKIRQIGEATREQELGVAETSKSMTELDRTAQNNNQAARNMSGLAEKAKIQGEELRKIAQGLQTLVVGKQALRELGKTPYRNVAYWGTKRDDTDSGPVTSTDSGELVNLVDRIVRRNKNRNKPAVGTKADRVGSLDPRVAGLHGVTADDESFRKKKTKS